MGGVRFGAKSKGKRMRLMCPACSHRAWHKVERRPGSSGGGGIQAHEGFTSP
jgi:hypothetical protein